jgi:hypothetical protein
MAKSFSSLRHFQLTINAGTTMIVYAGADKEFGSVLVGPCRFAGGRD